MFLHFSSTWINYFKQQHQDSRGFLSTKTSSILKQKFSPQTLLYIKMNNQKYIREQKRPTPNLNDGVNRNQIFLKTIGSKKKKHFLRKYILKITIISRFVSKWKLVIKNNIFFILHMINSNWQLLFISTLVFHRYVLWKSR